MHWTKKHFVIPAADFADNLPLPPINDELEPIDYFHLYSASNRYLSFACFVFLCIIEPVICYRDFINK